MKISELIAELQLFNPDAEAHFFADQTRELREVDIYETNG
jgi:hypothetical protein